MLVHTIEDLNDPLARYDYTANLSRGNWAWEFARRNSALKAAAYAAQPDFETRTACCDIQLLRLCEQDRQAEDWGLLYFPNPDQSALTTHVFWSDKTYPRKVAVHVRERERGEIDEIFEKSTRLCKIIHLVDAFEHEHILVKGKKCSIQVRCSGKSLLSLEPVKMEFSISGFSTMQDHVNALNRAQKVYGDDDMSPPVWSRKGLGYRNALVALDAHDAGLTYRETATIFYGEKRISEEWGGPSSAMKSEMARLLAKGQRLRDGEYFSLLEENL